MTTGSTDTPAIDPRERMIRSAADLQRATGVTATAFSDIIAHSGASRGSIYHHFPDGRVQLAVEATRYAADTMADDMRALLGVATPHQALDAFIAMWIALMEVDDFHVGCAVAAATIESRSAPALRAAADEGFRGWLDLLVPFFVRHGVPADTAPALATTVLAAVEGGIILARAAGGPAPLLEVGRMLHRLLDVETLPGAARSAAADAAPH